MIKVYKVIKASDKVNAKLLFTKSFNSRTKDRSLKLVDKSTDQRKSFSV